LVMATGIVAIAAHQQKLHLVADALYVITVIAYVALAVLFAIRIIRFWSNFAADVTNHAKGFAFLTTVAATNVLASASIVIHGWWDLAWTLWWISLALWAAFTYTTLIAVVIDRDKPGLQGGINGSWFLLTVSTQSIAVVAGLFLTRSDSDALAFAAIAAFTLGIVLYLIVMTMVFLRWTFHPLDPTEADPPAWIAAGAVAITVLAGSNILLAVDQSERLARLAPFLEGLVVISWATATFWFPLMIAIGIWRHLVRRVPLRYHPSYWAMVFPLGMYGAATYRMRAAIDFDALAWLPKLELAAAFAAWAITFVGLLQHLGSTARVRLTK
ncbi:MAG: tellurite resistance/C4-dicarboxylate transporter family protein, partial [Actinobacteria bacterium]|nr:tellurite resistance/C4-dicarboxylate transporter family protein [Actinomycetota bacterium]